MMSEVPALSRRSVRESELPLLPATLSFKLQKNASFVLNLHRVLTIFNKQPEDDQNYAYIQLKEQND